MKRLLINILLILSFMAIMTVVSLPFSAEMQYYAGERFVELKQWEEAEDAYAAAVITVPISSTYWVGYGDFLWELALEQESESAWEDIEPSYETAVSLNPNCAKCWTRLAQIQRINGEDEKADVNFEKALEVDPQGTDTAYWLEQDNVRRGTWDVRSEKREEIK